MTSKVHAADKQFREFLATRLLEPDASESALEAFGADIRIAWARAHGKVRCHLKR